MEQNHEASVPVSFAEKAFVVLVLLFSAGAFATLWTVAGKTANPSGMLVMQVLWICVYVVTIYAFRCHCDHPLRTFFSEWPLVVLCSFAIVSIFWSEAPGLTFRRSVALTLTFLFGVYFASRFTLKEQLRLLAWTCWICIMFSFIFGLFGLGAAVDAGGGVSGWYGIFVQKNDLGRMMDLSALVFLFWKRAEPKRKRLANAGFVASIGLIALSRSMTSAVVLALLMVLVPYLEWAVRKNARWMVAGILFLVVLGTASLFFVVTHLGLVTGILGKSATLTGRIQIWILSLVMVFRRPWLGYGFNAFWLPNEWFTVRIWRLMGWRVPHAHDGFIELLLELGLVGLGLFLLAFLLYIVRSVGFFRQNHGVGAAGWPLTFLLFLFLSNLTESDLLGRNSIFFILFVSGVLVTQGMRSEAYASAPLGIASHGASEAMD